MPIIASTYRPPLPLRNGHVQTILPVLLRRKPPVDFENERLELDDDFLDLSWARRGSDRLVILSHGLEGCSDNGYIRGMAAAMLATGWDALAWNFRGCGTEPNRQLRFYHSGETADLAKVIERAAQNYRAISLIGFSLGGNMTLKYLGEAAPHEAIRGGAAISAPVDLAASARALDSMPGNRIYLRRFLKTLVKKVQAKALRFPGQLDIDGARQIRSFQQFDDRFTAPLHGFRNAEDYWSRSSAAQYLHRISVPTLLLNARNDPFLTPESFPAGTARQNPFFHLEAPASGGHVGFIQDLSMRRLWSEKRVSDFLNEHTQALQVPG